MQDHDFEWDEAKNAANHAKHGVTFARACLVFADRLAVGGLDDREDYGEDRLSLIGMVEGTLLLVAYTERGVLAADRRVDRIRIVTARWATKHEQDEYYQQNS